MDLVLKFLSAFGLGLTVVPAFFVATGVLAWETHASYMLAGTILWFVTAPGWMGEAKPNLFFWKRRRIE